MAKEYFVNPVIKEPIFSVSDYLPKPGAPLVSMNLSDDNNPIRNCRPKLDSTTFNSNTILIKSPEINTTVADNYIKEKFRKQKLAEDASDAHEDLINRQNGYSCRPVHYRHK